MPERGDDQVLEPRRFARDVLAQALGTVLGAGLIFLFAQAFGLISDVPTSTWVGVVGVVIAILGYLSLWNDTRPVRDAVRDARRRKKK